MLSCRCSCCRSDRGMLGMLEVMEEVVEVMVEKLFGSGSVVVVCLLSNSFCFCSSRDGGVTLFVGESYSTLPVDDEVVVCDTDCCASFCLFPFCLFPYDCGRMFRFCVGGVPSTSGPVSRHCLVCARGCIWLDR